MDRCTGCNEPVAADAKFCAECGENLCGASEASRRGWRRRYSRAAALSAAIFVGVLLGAGLSAALMRGGMHKPVQVASRGPEAGQARPALPLGHANVGLPTGHPKFGLRSQTLDFIVKAQKRADASPKDVALWNRLGDLALRAAVIDPSNYERARRAFSHVLELEPDNAEALRGIGNVDFDQHKSADAVAAYEHYLSKRPDDAQVLTDLGTMYLSTGDRAKALARYEKALALKPRFFPAEFNLAVLYLVSHRETDARSALDKARTDAPNEIMRTKIDQMISKLESKTATGANRPGELSRQRGQTRAQGG